MLEDSRLQELEKIKQAEIRENEITIACKNPNIQNEARLLFIIEYWNLRVEFPTFDAISKWNHNVARHYVGIAIDQAKEAKEKVLIQQKKRDDAMKARATKKNMLEKQMEAEEERARAMKAGAETNFVVDKGSHIEWKEELEYVSDEEGSDIADHKKELEEKYQKLRGPLRGKGKKDCLVM